MDKQPEALRLAEMIEDDMSCDGDAEIAAELRRLHQENQELVESVKKANAQAEHFERLWYLRGDDNEELVEVAEMAAGIGIHTLPDRMKCRCSQCDMVNLARAILAKHKEQNG